MVDETFVKRIIFFAIILWQHEYTNTMDEVEEMDILKGLQPESVMMYFEALTKIPRGSGNEKEVSDYLVSFAKAHHLEVIQEPCNNIIIKKPGTAGYENAKTVILQGHMDIVCVKEDTLDFDFEKDPIPLVVEGIL